MGVVRFGKYTVESQDAEITRDITIIVRPKAVQSVRFTAKNNNVRAYTSTDVVRYKRELLRQLKEEFNEIFMCPVKVDITFYSPFSTGEKILIAQRPLDDDGNPTEDPEYYEAEYNLKHIDLDNLTKPVLDTIKTYNILDDDLIVELSVRKKIIPYKYTGRIDVKITSLGKLKLRFKPKKLNGPLYERLKALGFDNDFMLSDDETLPQIMDTDYDAIDYLYYTKHRKKKLINYHTRARKLIIAYRGLVDDATLNKAYVQMEKLEGDYLDSFGTPLPKQNLGSNTMVTLQARRELIQAYYDEFGGTRYFVAPWSASFMARQKKRKLKDYTDKELTEILGEFL